MAHHIASQPTEVFVSHSHRDQAWVREFVEELTKEGITAWLFEREIAAGEPIVDKLEEALRSIDTLVLILDQASIQSMNVNFELGVAIGASKRLIAVVDRDVPAKDLPGPIRSRRYLTKEQPKDTARDVAKALTSAA